MDRLATLYGLERLGLSIFEQFLKAIFQESSKEERTKAMSFAVAAGNEWAKSKKVKFNNTMINQQ